MKLRSLVLALAAAALVSGCGSSTDSVNVEPELDTTPPGAPGTVATAYDETVKRTRLVWNGATAADIAGYQIYRYDPDPFRDAAYSEFGEVDAATTEFEMPYVTEDTTFYVRVRAVDRSGNAGPFTAVLTVEVKATNFDDPS